MKRAGRILVVLLCMMMCVFCASDQNIQEIGVWNARLDQEMPDMQKEEKQDARTDQDAQEKGEQGTHSDQEIPDAQREKEQGTHSDQEIPDAQREKEQGTQSELEIQGVQDAQTDKDCWPEEDVWANSHESRICYENGYYYYASQLDHYYLYRAGTDGSQPQCLARVHPGSICVQDDEIYFINLSDGNGIYRMGTDGSGMEKLCDYGRELQIVGEYIFFCSTYQAAYDKTGMVREEPSKSDSGLYLIENCVARRMHLQECEAFLQLSQSDNFLYRMKRDGSEPELIAADVWKYVPAYGNGQKTRDACFLYYSYHDMNGICVRKIDLDGQMEEQICYFDIPGNMMVYGDSIYCAGIYYEDREQVSRYCFGDGEVTKFKIPEYTDCCIYDGRFYGINETEEENGRKIMVYRMDHDMQGHEVLYEDFFSCEYANAGYISDMYASEEGLFFRKFVSPTEGCQWFRLTENEMTGEWTAERWEDRERIPAALPAGNIEYGEQGSAINMLESTEGYEDYLAEDLEYEEFYRTDAEGREYNPYRIWLPQFNSKIAGYQKINRYFQNVYQEVMGGREEFFEALKAEEPELVSIWYQLTGYGYVYISEDYVSVAGFRAGFQGGIRSWKTLEPVTFDRESGEVVSLGEILGMSEQEAVAELTGSVYKYMEGVGRGIFFLKNADVLTKCYDPEQFVLCPDGIGIYYERYAIDSGAAGDYMFVIPYEDAAVVRP